MISNYFVRFSIKTVFYIIDITKYIKIVFSFKMYDTINKVFPIITDYRHLYTNYFMRFYKRNVNISFLEGICYRVFNIYEFR